MRKLITILICCLCSIWSFSQSSSLKGTVVDSVEKASLQNTVISILRKSDSVLLKYSRADKNGYFSFSTIKDGSFILMATHPYYGDFIDNIEIKAGEAKDMGKLYMTPKSKLLAEVILKSGSPIRIKGDTTLDITLNIHTQSSFYT